MYWLSRVGLLAAALFWWALGGRLDPTAPAVPLDTGGSLGSGFSFDDEGGLTSAGP